MLIPDILEFAARERPHDPALIHDDRRLTFAELWSEVRDMAAVLTTMTDPGDRVFMISDNRVEMVSFLYAAPLAGVIAAFGNTRLHVDELGRQIDDVGPRVLMGSAEQLARLGGASLGTAGTTVGLDRGAGDVFLDDLREHPRAAGSTPTGASASDVAWIIHTSGTTGRAKGACLTHRSLVAGVLNTSVGRPFADDDVYLFPFPLFHVASYNVLHAHLRRRPVVLMSRFDVGAVLDLVPRHGVTAMSLAPTMISMLLDHPQRGASDLSSLRTIAYGASAIPLGTLGRGLAELGCGFAQGYGMTELSGNAVFLGPEMHRRAVGGEEWILGACGRPGPLASVRLVDDDHRDVEGDESGEVWVRGDQVFSHYWEQPTATDEAFVDGWFRTGDVGRRREGVLQIVDRRKDIIVTGGENVASREVEDALSQHPDVAAVAVVGRPDERWGEAVCAVVVPRDRAVFDEEALREWARGRLGGFKVPKSVVVVDEMPLGASGKVLKAALRDLVTTVP